MADDGLECYKMRVGGEACWAPSELVEEHDDRVRPARVAPQTVSHREHCLGQVFRHAQRYVRT